jgi:hypothetical protein
MGHVNIFIVLLMSSISISLLWGGAPERIAAAIISFGVVATALVASPYLDRFSSIEINVMIVDVVMLVMFTSLCMYADRFWPIWISAMQLIIVVSHLPKLFMPHIVPEAYLTISAMWSYPIVATLIIATFRHQKRLRNSGLDRSWSGI